MDRKDVVTMAKGESPLQCLQTTHSSSCLLGHVGLNAGQAINIKVFTLYSVQCSINKLIIKGLILQSLILNPFLLKSSTAKIFEISGVQPVPRP